jgi:tRNA A37 N6-isopentenylltransferase MiaA
VPLATFQNFKKKKDSLTGKYKVEIINIKIDKEKLHEKIHKRLLERIESGMIEEVRGCKRKI